MSPMSKSFTTAVMAAGLPDGTGRSAVRLLTWRNGSRQTDSLSSARPRQRSSQATSAGRHDSYLNQAAVPRFLTGFIQSPSRSDRTFRGL